MKHLPKAGTIVTIVVLAFAAIWIANNVSAVGKLVAPRAKTA